MKTLIRIAVMVLFAFTPSALEAQDLVGDWQGTLSAGPTKLRLIVRVAKTENGWKGSLASIDQGPDWAVGVALESVSLQDRSFKFKVAGIGASYDGTLSADGKSIVGTFVQGGALPLELQRATKKTEFKDPSPHTSQVVTVNGDVRLEVLDWGGTGRPLVLLAGLGNSAHIFDTFAPKLRASYHVYGVTRRGFGFSSTPAAGYGADRLADDVLEILDALKLSKPVLAGHSVAGEELSSIGSRHPEKVSGLIYLDAGYTYAYYDPSAAYPPTPPAEQVASVPLVERSIIQGAQRYTKIEPPSLALYAFADAAAEPAQEAQIKAFEKGVPSARVVRVPRANHYLFLTNEATVLEEINTFMGTLK